MSLNTKILLVLAIFLILFGVPAAARPLPWTATQRYLYGGATIDSQDGRISPFLDVFTGDYPFVIHATHEEISLFTGLPHYRTAPFLFSFGSKTQFGFFDHYSSSTLFQSASFGWDVDISGEFRHDFFLSHSLRFEDVTAGWAFYGESSRLQLQTTLALEHAAFFADAEIGFSPSLDLSDWTIGADIITSDFWSMRLSLNKDLSFSVGVGLAHRFLPHDRAEDYEWDYIGAHRGSLARYPENSPAAFDYALSNPKYSFVETDITITQDGEYAAIHDPLLFRYTGERDLISDITLEELKTKDLGSFFAPEFSDQRVLDFHEMAELFDTPDGKSLVIELKAVGPGKEAIERTVRTIDELFEHDNYAFFTLYYDQADAMKEIAEKQDVTWGFSYLNSRGLPFFMMPYTYIYPLLEPELDSLREIYDPEFFIIITDALPFYDKLKAYAREHKIDIIFWDFKDNLYGISGDGGDSPMFMR